eukprot:CAMPEP_0173217878 /NCGR_PEP_ID=MMETSP1142-20121109/744_1 /TAXON_ID=483371 /ORGANISM="non described non described, Strain CCMP2298" /LENGTH=263 /DNA_ID=CAMNT_0014145515 /DNA_START=24 /DNA_END=812 /DNA_ORIENTATION=+
MPKGKKLSKGVKSTILRYCLLVYYGYKDAYLVDCCSLEVDETVAFIASIECEFKLQKSVLAALPLGSDVFIINTSIFKHKVETSNDIINRTSVVDVTASGYSLCSREDAAQYLGALGRSMDRCHAVQTGNIVHLSLSHEFEALVGPVLLAGWLLGYPSIYRSIAIPSANEDRTGNSSSLSMVNLIKVFIVADIVVQGESLLETELLSLSVPQSLLEQHDFEGSFRSAVSGIMGRLLAQSANPHILASNILLKEELVMVSSIVL